MLTELTPYVSTMIEHQNRGIKVWEKMDTRESLCRRIYEEGVHELLDAYQKCCLGAPPEFLISELGDVIYLDHKMKLWYPDYTPPKTIQGIVYCAYKLCEMLSIDPNQAVMMKWLRNDMKYLRSLGNNGFTPEQYVGLCKSQWMMRGGDDSFYLVWEEVADLVCQALPTSGN